MNEIVHGIDAHLLRRAVRLRMPGESTTATMAIPRRMAISENGLDQPLVGSSSRETAGHIDTEPGERTMKIKRAYELATCDHACPRSIDLAEIHGASVWCHVT